MDNPPEYPWQLSSQSLSIAEQKKLEATTKNAGRRPRKPNAVDLLESGADPDIVAAVEDADEARTEPGTLVDPSGWDSAPLSVLAGLTPDDPMYGLAEILAGLGIRSAGRTADVGRKSAMDDWFRKTRDKKPHRLIPQRKRKAVRDWYARNDVEVSGATLDVLRPAGLTFKTAQTPLIGSATVPYVDLWTRPKTASSLDPVAGLPGLYEVDLEPGAVESLKKPVRRWPFDDLIEWGIYTGCSIDPLPRLEPFTLFG